jgi:hypothetical protein
MEVKLTPKERAYELRERFYKMIPTRLMHFDAHTALAKSLALECLDEIVNAHYEFKDYGLGVEERRYYDSVKSELEKL